MIIGKYIAPQVNGELLTMREYDPTRTTTLRNVFARKMRVRFDELAKNITTALVEKDVLGLQNVTTQRVPGERAFDFPRSQDKVQAFMRWVREQMDTDILELRQMQRIGSSIDTAWTNVYVKNSYQRGLERARSEMRRAGYNIPTVKETGGVGQSLASPFHADRLGVLYTRTFNDLKGITDAMDSQMSRVLTEAIADGDGTRMIAKKLNGVIRAGGKDLGITDTLGRFIPGKRRAEMLARTEIIRAHHQATIQEYKNWKAQGVTVRAEWATAGDQRVCPDCASLENEVFTLEVIQNKIPLHPQCRCVALPIRNQDKAGGGWNQLPAVKSGELPRLRKSKFVKQ